MEEDAAEASAPGTDRQAEEAEAASASKAPADKVPLQEGRLEPEHNAEEDVRWDVEDEWETDDSEDEQDGDGMPSFEFRVETAKLLIELDEDNHAAVQVHLCASVAILLALLVGQSLAQQSQDNSVEGS